MMKNKNTQKELNKINLQKNAESRMAVHTHTHTHTHTHMF